MTTILATALKDRLPTTIRTQRLVLATPALAHSPAIAALANNANVHKWLARLPFPYALADAEHFITDIARSETEFAWIIFAEDAVIGTIPFADAQRKKAASTWFVRTNSGGFVATCESIEWRRLPPSLGAPQKEELTDSHPRRKALILHCSVSAACQRHATST